VYEELTVEDEYDPEVDFESLVVEGDWDLGLFSCLFSFLSLSK